MAHPRLLWVEVTPPPEKKHTKGHVKIIFLPVIALLFPLFCPKLEQALRKRQEQHSWHAGNFFLKKKVVSDEPWSLSQYGRSQQQENKEHGVFLSEGSPACLFIIHCWQNTLKKNI